MTSTAPKTSTRPESGGQKRPKGYRPGLLAVVAALMWVVALVGGLMSVDSGSDFPFGWWMAGGLVLLLLDVQPPRGGEVGSTGGSGRHVRGHAHILLAE